MDNANIGAVNGQQSLENIKRYCRDIIKFCDNEGQNFFDAIKQICNVTGAPGIAIPEDAACLWNFAFGREWVTRVEFTPWWEVVYATIGDPNCGSGVEKLRFDDLFKYVDNRRLKQYLGRASRKVVLY